MRTVKQPGYLEALRSVYQHVQEEADRCEARDVDTVRMPHNQVRLDNYFRGRQGSYRNISADLRARIDRMTTNQH